MHDTVSVYYPHLDVIAVSAECSHFAQRCELRVRRWVNFTRNASAHAQNAFMPTARGGTTEGLR